MKVDFVTLGGASEILDVPSPTLRNWTDQLEEYGVHYTKRNNRNERMYFKEDISVFEYVRDMKKEYGRKTTTQDITRMLAEDSRFKLRNKEDAPSPVEEPSNRLELLNQEDIKELMGSERVLQFVNIIVEQTTKNLKDELVKDVKENVHKELELRNSELEEMFEESERKHDETLRIIKEGNEQLLSRIELQSKKKGFWSSLFG